ncbi:uncharacterized protein H6S33_006665 [Morchella sextelata]|uniref:uncharacterized protein n=1 Tax=Morchella sextelata TaxID=1174677 RepID=UPI001D03AA6E|nr:uncharacterized protein H6S33_006665 [Morchella sextelata]KAH0604288.1 hypothetical protein H6S33_006665 [Morchella sextelata]
MPNHAPSTLTLTMPKTDPSNYPLIRELLQHYPSSSISDTHPSSWLSDPGVLQVLRSNMPPGYSDPTLLSRTGQLLMYGCPKASWRHCLVVEGLPWGTLKQDLEALFEVHDNVEPPIILGNDRAFMALVYMMGSEACEIAITDLDGAVVGGEAPLRVRFAGQTDLERALKAQGRGSIS